MTGTTEASDVYHFATFWSASAAWLRRRVWFTYGLNLYPNVYQIVYGPTGDRKTTATRRSIMLFNEVNIKTLQGTGTGEGLADWLTVECHSQPPSHFLLLEELSELLTRGKWEGATLVPFLMRVFDCPPKYEVNYRRKPIDLTEPTLSILACTTQEVFWQHVRDLDVYSGFVNRFIFLTGKGKEPIALPCKPDDIKLREVLQALAQLDAIVPQEAILSSEATKLWEDFYVAWRQTDFSALVKAGVERIPAYILKLAMTYASLERTLPIISVEQLTAAIAVGHYATKCAEELLSHSRHPSAQGRCEEAIRRVLRGTSGFLTFRQLWQRVSGRFDSGIVHKAISGLVSAGEIREKKGPRADQKCYRLASEKSG